MAAAAGRFRQAINALEPLPADALSTVKRDLGAAKMGYQWETCIITALCSLIGTEWEVEA